MKKTLLIGLLFVLAISLVIAQGQPNETGQPEVTGQPEDAGMADGANQGSENQGEAQQIKAQTKDELKQMIQERKQEMVQEMEGLGTKEQNVYRNQNTVREAVHTMLAMENLVGGIGKNISAIAKEFDNSVEKTIGAETKIEERGWFSRLMIGGDKESASALASEVAENRNRVQQLNRLMEDCECDEEVKAMLQEQLQNMEQEQTRLQELAEKEGKRNGLFGWLFNR